MVYNKRVKDVKSPCTLICKKWAFSDCSAIAQKKEVITHNIHGWIALLYGQIVKRIVSSFIT